MCAHSNDIDRLAAFCRLADKGYRRDPECGVLCEPEWVRDVPGGVEIWRPDESDDDCRVVLEAMTREQRKAFARELADMLYVDVCEAITYEDYTEAAVLWNNVAKLLLAPPAEKCAAVAKVMGWAAAEASDR